MRELNEKVPIHQKIALTISCAVREELADAVRARHLKEAAQYSNIGINKRSDAEHTKLSVCSVCRYKEAGEAERV